MQEGKKGILDRNAIPINYNIRLEPNLKSFKFHGHERISVKLVKKTNSIKLNSLDLDINSAYIIKNGKKQAAGIKADKESEQITLGFDEAVHGTVEIEIEFSGESQEKLIGFYRCRYLVGSKERYMMTTHWSPQMQEGYSHASMNLH